MESIINMKKFKMKRFIIGLIIAGAGATLLILIEFKYFIRDCEQLVPGIASLFMCQFALIVLFFQAIPCTINGLRKWRIGDNQLDILGKCGLSLEIISIVFLIVQFISFSSPYILAVITCANIVYSLLICMGIVQYYRKRGKLAISFVLWAIAMWLLEYILTGIGTVS